jgi:formylglycine-generating enzyme required for sulfatase activity
MLEQGLWRLDFRGSDGRRCELVVDVVADGETTTAVTRLVDETALDGVVHIPGGLTACEANRLQRAPDLVEVAPFALTVETVSRRGFWEALDAVGQWPPESWSSERVQAWLDPALLALPATSLTRDEMRRGAAALGMRLPPMAEWLAALGPPLETWAAAGGPGRANLVAERETRAFHRETVRPFEEAAVPTHDPEGGFPPYGLEHPFGNVDELVETHALIYNDSKGTRLTTPDKFGGTQTDYYMGFFWDDGLGAIETVLTEPTELIMNLAQTHVGFRCARSLP